MSMLHLKIDDGRGTELIVPAQAILCWQPNDGGYARGTIISLIDGSRRIVCEQPNEVAKLYEDALAFAKAYGY